MKKIGKIGLIFLSLTMIFTFLSLTKYVEASSIKVIPGGQNIGLKIDTGVYVVGKYEVETSNGKISPWKKTDIRNGDRIVEIDNQVITSNQDLQNVLLKATDQTLVLTILRNGAIFDTNIDLVATKNGDYSLGLYIKDRIVGIGTITFYDPSTKCYASLGHGIYDQTTVIGKVNGQVLKSNIEAIKKAVPGTPGEKLASLTTEVIGSVIKNSSTGVYGKLSNQLFITGPTVDVASQNEVRVGKAYIFTTLTDNLIGKYEIEIVEIYRQSSSNVKGLKIKMTDPNLINKTGGIIQGMSGSPIIQNNKLVGAVSHVTVDQPLYGYGMHIDWMLEDIALVS